MSLSRWDEGSDSDVVTGLNWDRWLVGHRKILAWQWAKLPRYGREGAVEVRPFTAEKRLWASMAQGLSVEAVKGNPTTTVIPGVDESKSGPSSNRRLDGTGRRLQDHTILPWGAGLPPPAFIDLVSAAGLKKWQGLEVGCGTGENALYLAEKGFAVIGVDLTSRAIVAARAKAAERKLKVNFREGNALSLDIKDSVFDNVIDSGLFHTFPDYDRPVYAREVAWVLARRGKYFMLCFSEKEPINWGGPRRVTREEIESTFSPLFDINYIRDALFATRLHANGGKAYLTSATRIAA